MKRMHDPLRSYISPYDLSREGGGSAANDNQFRFTTLLVPRAFCPAFCPAPKALSFQDSLPCDHATGVGL